MNLIRRVAAFAVALALALTTAVAPAAAAPARAAGPLAPAVSAQAAHAAGFFYVAGKWPASQSVSYGLSAGFPGDSEWSGRVYDGKQSWNNVAGANEPRFYWLLADYQFYGSWNQPCGLTSGNYTAIVFHQDLDSIGTNVRGYSQACNSGSNRLKETLAFDSTGTSWYTGVGATTGGWMDLWSATAHEWGHATGFQNHLTEGEAGICPLGSDPARHTMCPSIYAGTWQMRDANTHDIHTFTAAY